jgi:hypothetical protein
MSSDIMVKIRKPVETEFLIQRALSVMADLLERPVDLEFELESSKRGITVQVEDISIVPDEEMPTVLLRVHNTTAWLLLGVIEDEPLPEERISWSPSYIFSIHFRADGGLSELLAAAFGIVFAEVQGEDLDVCGWLTRKPGEDFVTVDELKRLLQSEEWFVKFKEGLQKGTITLP